MDPATGEVLPFNLASFLKDFICFYKTPKHKEVCDWWVNIDKAPSMEWPPYEHRVSLDATLMWVGNPIQTTFFRKGCRKVVRKPGRPGMGLGIIFMGRASSYSYSAIITSRLLGGKPFYL